MIYKSLVTRLSLLISFLFLTFNYAAADELADQGKVLFKANCQSCHNKSMIDDMTGPALGGINERWEGREELLYQWIRNSQAVIASGDAYAVGLYNDWNKSVMSSFQNLSDEEINSLLYYIQGVYDGSITTGVPVNPNDSPGGAMEEESDNTFLFITLFLILGILALVLTRIISNLNRMVDIKDGKTPAPQKSLLQSITSSKAVGLILFALIIFGGYTTVNNAIDLGRQQGYQPDQPIKFSHATHAGLQEIECQYCHDGARRSKHSVIPAANTCMNCHSAIKKGSQYGTAEISKIYASIGFNPKTNAYIENYDQMAEEDIEKVFKEWISGEYIKDNKLEDKLDKKGAKEVARQWAEIKSSLTNETKPNIQGPIEWIKIHNLPDHVYFNHAQHVSVGKVECQECHGPVEKMEIVEQHSPLSMGWCVNCHRTTEVKFKDNPYYESYTKYHEQFEDGKRDKVTVEEIGGLECQKCHY